MRLALLLLSLVLTVIFLVQNQQPVVLYFLGTNSQTALLTLSLPVSIWVVLFTVAGILTSLIIQIFTGSPQPSSPKTYPSQPRSPRRSPSETPKQRSKASPIPPSSKKSDWEIPPKPDWEGTEPREIDDEDDWNIEEPPTEPTIPSPKQDKPLPEAEGRSFEVQQPPKTVSRQGSVYTYTYRELSDRQDTPPHQESPPHSPETQGTPSLTKSQPDQVYDANYRVITPPYQDSKGSSPSEDEENEDNWV